MVAAFLAGFSAPSRECQAGFSRPSNRAGFFSSPSAFWPWFAHLGNGVGIFFPEDRVRMPAVSFFCPVRAPLANPNF
jgi:hypothetical protein